MAEGVHAVSWTTHEFLNFLGHQVCWFEIPIL